MPAPAGPIVLAAATAAIGNFFQNRSAAIAHRRAHRDAELQRAEAILMEVSGSMDTFFYYLRYESMPVAMRKAEAEGGLISPEDTATWGNFNAAVLAWNSKLNSRHVQVEQYFSGKSRSLAQSSVELLGEVTSRFREARMLVESTFYKRKGSIVSDDPDKTQKAYEDYKKKVDEITPFITDLSHLMTDHIQAETVGDLAEQESP